MSTTIFPQRDEKISIPTGPGALQKILQKKGKLPNVGIVVKPIDKSPQFFLDRFTSYTFNSNIMVPVDTFSFNFVLDEQGIQSVPVKSGDIIYITANQVIIGTGIIDVADPPIVTGKPIEEKLR